MANLSFISSFSSFPIAFRALFPEKNASIHLVSLLQSHERVF